MSNAFTLFNGMHMLSVQVFMDRIRLGLGPETDPSPSARSWVRPQPASPSVKIGSLQNFWRSLIAKICQSVMYWDIKTLCLLLSSSGEHGIRRSWIESPELILVGSGSS